MHVWTGKLFGAQEGSWPSAGGCCIDSHAQSYEALTMLGTHANRHNKHAVPSQMVVAATLLMMQLSVSSMPCPCPLRVRALQELKKTGREEL